MSQRHSSSSLKGKDSEGKGSSKGRVCKEGGQQAETDCPTCGKKVGEEDLGLECEICEAWYHIKCQGVSESEYEFLSNHKSLHWYCSLCNKNVAKVIKMVSGLKQRQDKLEEMVTKMSEDITNISAETKSVKQSLATVDKSFKTMVSGIIPEGMTKTFDQVVTSKVRTAIKPLEEELKSLKDQISSVDAKLETAIEAKLVDSITKSTEIIRKELEPSWASVVSKEVDSKLEKVNVDVTKVQQTLVEVKSRVDEEKDKENRSHNIIIYRVEEVDSREERVKADKDFCTQLFNEVLELNVQESDVRSIFRIGKKEQNLDRPLLVQFREKSMKYRVMETLYKLRVADERFKRISVTHDFTKAERTECKTLVEEAKRKQQEEQEEFLWRVRGLPGQLKVIRIRKN